MIKPNTSKKHIVASYRNLTPELQDEIKRKYPLGFTDHIIRVDKPNGEFFCAIPYETDQINYLIKIDVKIDDNSDEEEDKDFYDEDIKDGDDIQSDSGSGGDRDEDDDM